MTSLSDLRTRAAALDAADPLASRSTLFSLPEGSIYLDGNSLGPPPIGVAERVQEVATREWGQDLITSWNKNGWMTLSARIGDRLATLLGAQKGSIRACDSTSVNLFKVLSAALSLRPDRRVIVSERKNFPTDLYVAQEMIAGLGKGYRLRLIDDAATDLEAALDAEVAVVMLTQVDYRTGRRLNMAETSDLIRSVGAISVWDLAHSAGAFQVNLERDGADFAIGCGYKFLNGGPGAPAFLYVSPIHQDTARPMLAGWLGHAAPFAFSSDYEPATGIDRYIVGTPPVLSMAAFDQSLNAFDEINMTTLEVKAGALGDLFIDAVEALCAPNQLVLASPRNPSERGAQVSFHAEEGYAIVQAMIARGVTGDFRAPDIARFGFGTLYLNYGQIVEAAAILAEILETAAWDHPAFKTQAAVT